MYEENNKGVTEPSFKVTIASIKSSLAHECATAAF